MDAVTKLADAAAARIGEWPVMTGKEKLKRLIRGALRQKQAPCDHFSWPNAMLGEGLLAAYESTGEEKYLFCAADYLKRWTKSGCRIYYVDNIMNGGIALWISALTGQGEVQMRRQEISECCDAAVSACADWLAGAVNAGKPALFYRRQHPDWIFADGIGMVCPFLCRYGAQRSNEKALRLGTALLTAFLQKGMDEATGLPYHGYDDKSGLKYGIIGWGRACGWLMKGLSDSLPYIPEDDKAYSGLLEAYRNLAKAVVRWRRPDGGFSWQLQATEGRRDTSAEGMIGTAIIKGLHSGYLKAEDAGNGQAYEAVTESLAGLLEASLTDSGMGCCSGECEGFAQYPQIYGVYPWGTGGGLEFLSRRSRWAE